MITRDRIQLIFEDELGSGDHVDEIIVPNGENWQIAKITFADMSKNDNKSGVFRVEFGQDDDRDVVAIAYLSGNTISLPINRSFIGDGAMSFRIIRKNQSNPAKNMMIFIEGFKRIGDVRS